MSARLAKAGRIAERERRGRTALERELHEARATEHAASIATLQRALAEAEAHVQRVERSRYGYSPSAGDTAPCRWPPNLSPSSSTGDTRPRARSSALLTQRQLGSSTHTRASA